MKKFFYFPIALILLLTSVQCNAGVFDGRFYPTDIPKATQTSTSAPRSINDLLGHFDHKITTVFSDIDGTLLPLDNKRERGLIPESVKLGAQKLKQAKIPLILVTGRSSGEARQIAKRMGNENTYVIGQQGAEIVNPEGKMIYEDGINNKDTKRMLKEIAYFNKKNHQNSKAFFYVDGKAYSMEKITLPYLLDEVNVVKSPKELKPNFTSVKVGICDTNPKHLRAIQQYLKKKFPNYHVDISADCYCDISSYTATKGNAINKLSQILKVNLKNAAVLGDAENDISMLKLIRSKDGLAIAVGNAMETTKSNANYITAPVYEDGFYKAVNKILENNATLH